jgi:hypothetical protein
MERVRVTWATGAGGTGLSTFYFVDGTAAAGTAALGNFFAAQANWCPAAVSWTVPANGDVLSPTTGLLTGVWSGGTPSTHTGSGTLLNYAAGTGAYVRWITAGIVTGHRVQGRTFICPIGNGAYDSSGSIDNTVLASMQTAASSFLTAVSDDLVIWSRPKTGTTGSQHPVVSTTVPDKVTSLRSRRS